MRKFWGVIGVMWVMCCLTVVAFVTFALGADPVTTAPVPVVAAPAVNSFGSALAGFFSQTVFPILSAFLLGLVSIAVKKFGDKYKIATLQENNNFLVNLAAQGVALAEEKGAAYLKNQLAFTGNQKLNAAVEYVMLNAPKVSREQAESLVHSALGSVQGAGATGESAVL